jgi:hypothetical protein
MTLPTPEGDPLPIVGIFDLLFETSDEPAGLYRQGTGPDEEVLIVYSDGTAQRMRPTIQSPDEFESAASAIPGVERVEVNLDGTIELDYQGAGLILKPLFDVLPGMESGSATPELIIEDGRFFFINSNGDRQEFVTGT